ncbi:hypothetical protein SKAU_G00010800 [Synaphobranchus kaupii]|uniref:Uncharacterized protein n=1 Tax=Synaphobranchus kaupii TaxID=118154 RepID=A0A9Q1GA58_SYNKA|nr:hypothetical protein SKAU_G00010800 [Synaphobranchus kaupii]
MQQRFACDMVASGDCALSAFGAVTYSVRTTEMQEIRDFVCTESEGRNLFPASSSKFRPSSRMQCVCWPPCQTRPGPLQLSAEENPVCRNEEECAPPPP